jgi:ferrous-iron efflux pump FieF
VTGPVPENDAQSGAGLRRAATYASLSVGLILVAIKLAAFLATGAVTILASLLDSFVDVGASLIALTSVHMALKPADRGHRFGHGKAEGIGALAQAGFIGGSGVFVVIQAIQRLISPEPIPEIAAGIAVMGVSVALSLLLVAFQTYVIKRTGSLAVDADSVHYRGDLFTNLAVIFSLLVYSRVPVQWLDPLVALGIALYLFWNAGDIGKRCIDLLMDKELPSEERARIHQIVETMPGIEGHHDLRTRTSGIAKFAEMHIELDPAMSIAEAHKVTDRLEAALKAEMPDLQVTLHQEPAGLCDLRLDDQIYRRT